MTISEFKKCANCGACYNICGQNAISVIKRSTFYMPVVNNDLCINCGQCVEVCPVNNEVGYNMPLYACAGWHIDDNVIRSSSSGGAFYGIAKKVISEGGVVFSAIYSDDYKEVYFESSDDVEISRFQKSKYVESCVNDIFIRIKGELKKRRQVLFCGTPCQVAGLKTFLKDEYFNLLTCDFACGGLPSHHIYTSYLEKLEKKYGSNVTSVDFRPKTYGWKRYAVHINFKNGKVYTKLGTEDPYLRSFLYSKYTKRSYCLECKFSNQHLSDITIADFWQHKEYSSLTNNNGISLILCNTLKGKDIINHISDNYTFEEIPISDVCYNNKPTVVSEKDIQLHNDFITDYEDKGFYYCYNKYLKISLNATIKNYIRRLFLKLRKRNK